MSAVRILFFSVLREKLGRGSVELSYAEAVPAREVIDELVATYPAIAPYRNTIRIAVNETYVDEAHTVVNGDEMALITPVSGG